jgi:hypothetical protein
MKATALMLPRPSRLSMLTSVGLQFNPHSPGVSYVGTVKALTHEALNRARKEVFTNFGSFQYTAAAASTFNPTPTLNNLTSTPNSTMHKPT